MRRADAAAILVALTLPWSTTANAIATVLWLISLIPLFDRATLVRTLRHPASITAIALVALGALGMLWADVPWAARFSGLGRFIKLLAIPLLFYHFRLSERGYWVLGAFLASCLAILAVSWVQFAFPQMARAPYLIGVPVKNYIVQSQEFTLCIFALVYLVLKAWQDRRFDLAAISAALAAVFFINLLFVASSRTTLIVIVVLFAVFSLRFFRGRVLLGAVIAAIAVGALAWSTSPYLRERTTHILVEFDNYQRTNIASSAGQRIEYWRKSLQFIAEAPVLGHGTGSIQSLFERAAIGQTGVSADVVSNPHNQTFAVAIQLGLIGIIFLYVMWIAHLRLHASAEGFAAWIGLTAVVQNMTSSLLNSHLFDSAEGWIYVLAVGVAGGMVLKARDLATAGET